MTEDEFRGARVMAALANVIRFRIVLLLEKRKRTPRELADELHRTPARISHHLAILRAADLVRFKVIKGEHFYWLKCVDAAKVCHAAVTAAKKLRSVAS